MFYILSTNCYKWPIIYKFSDFVTYLWLVVFIGKHKYSNVHTFSHQIEFCVWSVHVLYQMFHNDNEMKLSKQSITVDLEGDVWVKIGINTTKLLYQKYV